MSRHMIVLNVIHIIIIIVVCRFCC